VEVNSIARIPDLLSTHSSNASLGNRLQTAKCCARLSFPGIVLRYTAWPVSIIRCDGSKRALPSPKARITWQRVFTQLLLPRLPRLIHARVRQEKMREASAFFSHFTLEAHFSPDRSCREKRTQPKTKSQGLINVVKFDLRSFPLGRASRSKGRKKDRNCLEAPARKCKI
jgi:hypothetical protein